MKKMGWHLWGALMLLCVFCGVAHAVVDLSGVWVKEGGQFDRRVVQAGNQVKFRHEGGWPDAEEPKGYVELYGTFDGKQLVGKYLVLQFDGDYSTDYRKSVCGKDWKLYVDIRLTLSADGNTLAGEWLTHPASKTTCQPGGPSAWMPIKFVRKMPVVVTKPIAQKQAPPPLSTPHVAELPKVELQPPASPAPTPMVPEPSSSRKSVTMGAGLLAIVAVVFFFFRNAYVTYLVGSLKRAPNDANLAGWALFGGFMFASAVGSIALVSSDWLTWSVLGGLGSLSAACFGVCALTSRRK